MKQYLRNAEVTISDPATATSYTFRGLRVSFSIEKSTESTPNDSRITVYNLSKDSRAVLEGENLIVRLDVGYKGIDPSKPAILSQLFKGNVRYVVSQKQGADYVTIIEAGDGEKTITQTTHEQSFPENTPVLTVIKSLIGKMDVAIGDIAPLLGKLFTSGASVTGLASKTLDEITKSFGLEWHVTDGELNVLEKGAASTEPLVYVTSTTGLIGTPSKRRPDTNSGDTSGFQFRMLINPEVKPSRMVRVESLLINGDLRVDRVRFSGDTHAGDWIAEVEAS